MKPSSLNRTRAHDEEGESVFVSMTDMTVSFLFIVMILLAFFASQFRPDEVVERLIYEETRDERDEARIETLRVAAERDDAFARIEALEAEIARLKERDPIEVYVTEAARVRTALLARLRDELAIEFPDIDVIISPENDALRFQGEGLFVSAQATVREERRGFVQRLAERLDALLPCYTLGPRSAFSTECNPSYALVEAVQIEGHTDASGGRELNMDLSAARGVETYRLMTGSAPDLIVHENLRDQPALSVAAYGEDRPVATNETIEGRGANRRIDLRFIMTAPTSHEEIARIRERLADPRPKP